MIISDNNSRFSEYDKNNRRGLMWRVSSKVERTLVSVLQPVQRSHLCEYNLLILPYPFHSDICPEEKN